MAEGILDTYSNLIISNVHDSLGFGPITLQHSLLNHELFASALYLGEHRNINGMFQGIDFVPV